MLFATSGRTRRAAGRGDINDAVDRPVGINVSECRQDREQHDVRQPIQLARARLGSSISASKVTNGVNDAMGTHPRSWRLPAKELDGAASQESPMPLSQGG